MSEKDKISYHNLHITTAKIPRKSIFNLPYGLEVSCNRVSGWTLWNTWEKQGEHEKLASEYGDDDEWLVLDVNGFVICDSRKE